MNIRDNVHKLVYAFQRQTRQYSITSKGKKVEIIKYHDGTREVRYNGVVYSRISPNSILTHSYWDYFLPLAYAYENARVLMIGLGGGTIAYQLEKALAPISKFDIVEVDQDMINLARLFYPDMRANIIKGDGLEYIKDKRGQYDMIILDAYINYSIPAAFISKAFIDDACAALSSNGILAINYLQDANGAQASRAFIEMLKASFNVYTLATKATLYNTIILASKSLDGESIYRKVSAGMPKEYAESDLMRSYLNIKKA
ncbi:MAG: fused MFS/spermidine synthase [Candidatus Micrarchaeaceae archaeon]